MAPPKRVETYNRTTQQQRCQPVKLMAPPKATRVSTEKSRIPGTHQGKTRNASLVITGQSGKKFQSQLDDKSTVPMNS